VVKGKYSIEKLSHFRCGACDRWWSIGDVPESRLDSKKYWYCPWCGEKQTAKKLKTLGII